MIWTLAVRNVMRNRRRSAITVLSIAVGLAALTFLWGFIDGMNRQMVTNTTRYFAADAQVHLKGYHDDPSLDRAIEAGARYLVTWEKRILKIQDGGTSAAAELRRLAPNLKIVNPEDIAHELRSRQEQDQHRNLEGPEKKREPDSGRGA